MTPAEFKLLGAGIFAGAYGWQSALARALDVDPRRVRAWLAGESDIPESVASQVRARAAATTGVPLSVNIEGPEAMGIPEWIVGTAHDAADEDAPKFLVHTRRPRFVARLIDEAEEGAALGRELHVESYWAPDLTWLDRRPDDEAVRALIARAPTLWRRSH